MPEHSLSDLASRFAALEQRVANNERLLADLRPLSREIATLAVNVADLIKRWDKLEESQESARKDSRSLRNILIGVGVAAVLSPLLAFLFAAVVAKP